MKTVTLEIGCYGIKKGDGSGPKRIQQYKWDVKRVGLITRLSKCLVSKDSALCIYKKEKEKEKENTTLCYYYYF